MQDTNPYLLTLPELLSAKKKISRVSAHHDPEKTTFKGMECLYLDPTEFREQLKRNFLIVLSDGELGALVTLLDKVSSPSLRPRERNHSCKLNSSSIVYSCTVYTS